MEFKCWMWPIYMMDKPIIQRILQYILILFNCCQKMSESIFPVTMGSARKGKRSNKQKCIDISEHM